MNGDGQSGRRPYPDPADPPVALTVAGTDSGGGAGVAADLRAMAARGVFGTSAVTAVTAQNSRGVRAVEGVAPDTVSEQVAAVLDDFAVGAAKTGMLGDATTVEAVADALDGGPPTVVDPVMVAQSGDRLLTEDGEDAVADRLVPTATVVTPNVPEAELLTGVDVDGAETAVRAAERLVADGPAAALVTGGHLDGDQVRDVLRVDPEKAGVERPVPVPSSPTGVRVERHDDRTLSVVRDRVTTDATHGSGCTLSAALAAELARDSSVPTATVSAVDLVDRAVRHGLDVGQGYGAVHGLAGLRNDATRYDAVESVRTAVDDLITADDADVTRLIPEVGTNVAVATPYARDPAEVAAVEGRLAATDRGVRPAGPPRLGASSHVARLLLAVRDRDPRVGAACNVRFDDAVGAALDGTSLTVVEVDRTDQPPAESEREGTTMGWVAERVTADRDSAPDAVFDRGAHGKEPMVRLFAGKAATLVDTVVELAATVDRTTD